MSAPKSIAVVLFQLGGPDTQAAVEPFLYNLFRDPDIINFPGSFLARKPLAKLISATRAKAARRRYAEIGGGSPIRRLTEQQARALEAALSAHISARTIVAMRYWHPDTQEAIAALERRFLRRTRSSPPLSRNIPWPPPAAASRNGIVSTSRSVPVHLIHHFFDHPDYIAAIVERIRSVLSRLAEP